MSYWSQRIFNSNKFYQEWEAQFKCRILEDYWECKQWKGRRDWITVNYNPYTLNLFYTTIKTKLANLLFQKPSFVISPRPGNSQWDLDFAVRSAELKQDTLNTIVQNPNSNFTQNVRLALLDSYLRFGLLEVGYAADWRNPQKENPLLSDHGEDEPDDKARVKEDNEVPDNERFYFKRINPRRFRVAVSDATELNDHEWCGYYDFVYTKFLRKTKGIKFPNDIKEGIVSADYTDANVFSGADGRPDFLRLLTEGEISKVWNIWDCIEHKRLLLLEDGNSYEELWSGENERLPFQDLRWDYRQEGFYPMPPSFQWLSQQDEINEAREQTRSYRRRFTRKFGAKKGTDPLALEKFASGPDGVVIEDLEPDSIFAIQNPDQTQTTQEALMIAKDDFYTISANSSNIQASDRETATQSKILAQKQSVRESAEAMDFSVWLGGVGREVLAQAVEKLETGLWVKYTTNPSEQVLTDMQVDAPIYKYITAQHLSDGYDFDIDVDVMNNTPAAQAAAQQSYTTFLALCHQFPETAMSPVLIRENAYRSGYRNEKVIHQMQQVALLAMAAKASSAANQQGQTLSQVQPGGNGNNPASAQVSQMASPTGEQTETQIQQQLM